MNILVIDVGTSSMRGILLSHKGEELTKKQCFYKASYKVGGRVEQSPSDWEGALYMIVKEISAILLSHKGEELTKKQCFYKASYKVGGRVEQSPSDWEGALYMIVKEISAKVLEEGWKIDAISITAQRSSVIPMDVHLRPLSDAIMWQDKRANEICEALQSENERIFSLCGSRANPVFSGGKIAWIKKHCPELYRDTYKFMVIPDYLIYLMTGNICTDHTYGSRSLLMNLRTCEWEPELLALFGVEAEKLCDLVEPGSVCGVTSKEFANITGCREGIPVITAGGDQQCGAVGQGVIKKDLVEPGSVCGVTSKEFANITGCREGIPVITAGGDQQCGAVGQGVIKKGILSVTAGTGGYLEAASEGVPENLQPDIVCNVSSVKNQYILEASVLTCCSAFDWFRREFYENADYEEINKVIASVSPGANGCLCLPCFQGRSTPDWNNEAKGMFANVTLATTKKDMLRSLLEGIAYELGNGIENMKKYVEISSVYVNGGLTESEVFNEIQCNVYGSRIVRRGTADATARGALMIGATALGMYDTVESAFGAISQGDKTKAYKPSAEISAVYARCREEMNRVYDRMWN